MLLENTPGYEKNTSSSAGRNESTRGGGQEMRSDQKAKPRSDHDGRSRSDQNTKSDQNFTPKSDPKAVLMRGNTPSYPPQLGAASPCVLVGMMVYSLSLKRLSGLILV